MSRDIIIPCFPLYYERYIEVFGGGWILFAKPPGNDHEIFNDANSNISNTENVPLQVRCCGLMKSIVAIKSC